MPAKNITLYAKWELKKVEIEDATKEGYIQLKDLQKSHSPSTYKKELNLPDYYKIKIIFQGKELDQEDFIPTGSVSVFYVDEKEVEKYTNIVKGDPTKDGKVDLEDIKVISKYILSNTGLKEKIEFLAADVKEDGEIRLSDLVSIYEELEGIQ